MSEKIQIALTVSGVSHNDINSDSRISQQINDNGIN